MGRHLTFAFATFLFSEPAMMLVHRRVFHGPLWRWHRSHHVFPAARRLVPNDMIWLGYFTLAGAVALAGVSGVGLGMALYGFAYIFAHDGVAHGRLPIPTFIRRLAVLRALTKSHHWHHREGAAGGAPPFGVYLAPIEIKGRRP